MSAAPVGEAAAAPPRRERLVLTAVLALAALLRLWDLSRGGWGAEYYSAAVRSMSGSLHALLFAAFDPAGFVSIDKPPGAFVPQVVAVWLAGYSPLSLLLPQALEGIASVWLLHRIVRPRAGAVAAAVAALLLAVTPVWIAVNRTNTTDSALTLVLLAAAWALLAAIERGSIARIALAAALLGLAFDVKMLAAFVVLPAFVLAWLAAARTTWPRRLGGLAVAGAVLAVTAGAWVAVVEFAPASSRPWVGGSRGNSMLELVVGHNAASRFGRVVFGAAPAARPSATADAATSATSATGATPSGATPSAAGQVSVPGRGAEGQDAVPTRLDPETLRRSLLGRLFVLDPAGPLRLFDGLFAAQAGWWLPLAAAGLALAFVRRGGAGALPMSPESSGQPDVRAFAGFWALWLACAGAVYSLLGGIVHHYYVAPMAPAFAALAGIAVARLGADPAARARGPGLAILMSVAVLGWQVHLHRSALRGFDADPWTGSIGIPAALGLGLAALVAGAGLAWRERGRPDGPAGVPAGLQPARLTPVAAAVALSALLPLPLAWAASVTLLPANGLLPSADFARALAAARDGQPAVAQRVSPPVDHGRLIAFLQAQRQGERFLLATSTSQVAAPLIIATGAPVMARGGFHGTDGAVSPDSLAHAVADGTLRFALVGDVSPISRRLGADAAARPVTDWIRAHGRPVDPALWRAARPPLGMERMQLYDLRPGPLATGTPSGE